MGAALALSLNGPADSHAAEKPPELSAVVLGKGAPETPVGVPGPGGTYVLTGEGKDTPDNAERGSFAAIETDAPDFTFVARVAKGPEGTADPQYGLSVRAGRDGPEKAVTLRYDGREARRCVGWLMRHHVTPSSHDGGNRSYHLGYDPAVTAEKAQWMKVVRRYPHVALFTSADGKAWHEIGADYRKVLLPQKVWVGLKVMGGGDGKSTVSVTFDNIAFRADPPEAGGETAEALREYHPPVKTHLMYLAKAEGTAKKADDRFYSPFLLMPKGMRPESIRAIVYSAGSKEMSVGGKSFPFDKGAGGLRKPAAMADWEGTLEVDGLDPFVQVFEHYGIVRVGGYFPPEQYTEAVKQLARVSGIAHLPNLPFLVTGASFAGAYSAKAAQLYPDKAIAAAPVIMGMAGSETTDPKVLAVPHLHVFGSRDGGHLADVQKALPALREKHALWGAAPMWKVYHRQHKSNALIFPFFLEAMRLRLPADADATKGPVALNALKEEDGWIGWTDTWETNAPKAVPFREYKGEAKDAVWLPSETVARVWEAFVSENPKTVIHFPSFEGHDTFGQPVPHGWHNSFLEANKPFEVVASGALGEGLTVEYYAGTRKLKVLKGSGYRVTLEGLEPGLHAIYAVTTLGGVTETSRPVTILFQARR